MGHGTNINICRSTVTITHYIKTYYSRLSFFPRKSFPSRRRARFGGGRMENFTFRLVSTTVLILVLCSSLRRAEVVKLEIPITKENLETINKIRENEDVDGQKSEPTVLTVQVDVSKITEAIDDRFAKLEEKMDSVKKEIKKERKKECACQNGTEPFTTMVETVFVGGTAGASSEWSQRYAAEYAFLNKPPKKSGGGWT